jgi:Carbohydrate binding module (family 6)
MKKQILIIIFLVQFVPSKTISNIQQGKPWQNKAQLIPGRIECELYDQGGEGVAYHDADSINNGSGKLNPANGNFLNEFRMKEGVDISYTKPSGIDDNPYNQKTPELNQLYLGWTQPGEWVNYTVKVSKTGLYRVAVMYTSNAGGVIALDIDGKQAVGQLKIPSTYDARDTVAWRQWHHWNRLDALAEINMKKGTHLLTLHIVEKGNMNFDWLSFEKQ